MKKIYIVHNAGLDISKHEKEADKSFIVRPLPEDPSEFLSSTNIFGSRSSQIFFIISIDYFIDHQKIFSQFLTDKSKSQFSLFIVFSKTNYKEIAKVKLDIQFTLLPLKELHNFFDKFISLKDQDQSVFISSQAHDESEKMLNIATMLGSEHNIEILLNRFLTTCMELTDADAGSLAVLGFDKQFKETDNNILTFYVSKNNSKEIHFNRFSMKIGLNSLAGYSIIKKKILNIPDAYEIPTHQQYSFNNSFDQQTGFRTKSVLVVPMIDTQNNAIGVIQLLNKKKDGYDRVINYDSFSPLDIIPYSVDDQAAVQRVTNFASVLLKNQLLYNQVNDLLENFVKASVYAVEQRDPATSGHSERVATYTVALAKTASKAKGVMEQYHFDEHQLRELRYASLLHDFGKIGVREKTLVKANKLEDYELELILKKIRVYLLNFQLQKEKQKNLLYSENILSRREVERQTEIINNEVKQEFIRFNSYKEIIQTSNVPRVIEEEASRILTEIHEIRFLDEGVEEQILNDSEFNFLNIKRGSLSADERLQIESHVTKSFDFLQRINWIPGLKSVPDIAYGHHEKLDGTGYPRRLVSEEILPQTKIMTICDIYDALTAADRPYKKSLTPNDSFRILQEEVNHNKIDADLVELFIKKKIYQVKPEDNS